MHIHPLLAAVVASAPLCRAAPAPAEIAIDASVAVDATLRLIKTSETDNGTWVREDEKIENYVAKGINFVDITDITDEEVLQKLSSPPEEVAIAARAVTYPSTLSHQTEGNALIADISASDQKTFLKTLTDFYNRYYRSTYGTTAATWLFDQVKSAAAANSAITVTQFTHSYSQPSVIATIPGTSTDIVIVSAHFDSTGTSSSARGPGADDNGSGVVVIFEALRVLAAASFKPTATLEFHFYSGEEGGLLGSADVFKSYKAAKKVVLAVVNQDMAGYSPSGAVSVYTDYVDASLTAYVRKIAEAYTGVKTTSDVCGYACSDHQSATANGYPAAYVCDEPIDTSSPYIHSAKDTYDTIQWDAILRQTQFTIGFLVEAAYL